MIWGSERQVLVSTSSWAIKISSRSCRLSRPFWNNGWVAQQAMYKDALLLFYQVGIHVKWMLTWAKCSSLAKPWPTFLKHEWTSTLHFHLLFWMEYIALGNPLRIIHAKHTILCTAGIKALIQPPGKDKCYNLGLCLDIDVPNIVTFRCPHSAHADLQSRSEAPCLLQGRSVCEAAMPLGFEICFNVGPSYLSQFLVHAVLQVVTPHATKRIVLDLSSQICLFLKMYFRE